MLFLFDNYAVLPHDHVGKMDMIFVMMLNVMVLISIIPLITRQRIDFAFPGHKKMLCLSIYVKVIFYGITMVLCVYEFFF